MEFGRKVNLKRSESTITDVNLVSSFCPSLVVELIGTKTNISLESKFLSGACLIADISGFVKLCGELSKCGADGFDDLQICTRTFIGDLVKIVYHYGGDVISFAGDAIICFFPSREKPQSCCWKAILCAVEMRDLRSLNLTAHIGVSYGEICFVTLGGYDDQWVYLMSGQPLDDISICVADAHAGEAVVTSSCFEHASSTAHTLNCTLQGVQIDNGNFKILEAHNNELTIKSSFRPHNPFAAPHLENILKFIPPSVRASISAGSFTALSELREVTTMFLKLDTYSHTSNKDLLTLQPFFHGIQVILGQCGGFLRQFLVDDKGCVLIVVWGVPKASYPNNCSRAITCAVKARAHCISVDHSCSIGITTGHAYCGTVGSMMRQDYVAMGDAVNLAARLMGKARSRILVDSNTFSRLPSKVSQHFQLAEPLILKGREESFHAYFYHSNELPVLPSYDDVDDFTLTIDKSIAQIITGELDRLSDYQSHTNGIISPPINLARGSTDSDQSDCLPTVRFILVEGFPGSGKSTVADFFQKGSFRRNFRNLFLKLTSDSKVLSYGLIRKLFVELVGLSNFNTERKQRQILLSLLRNIFPGREIDVVLRDHFPILRHALGLSWDFNPAISSQKPIRESKFYGDTTIQRIIHSLLRTSCTTLVIEDAHFCDDLSMKEIISLLNTPTPLLVLCTFRLQAEQAVLHMQKRPSFKYKVGTQETSSLSEAPGRLKDSPSFRGHFYPNEFTEKRSPTQLPGLGPRSNSQRRMSVPLSHGDEEIGDADTRRRFTITDSSSSFKGLYTNSASNSHSQGIQNDPLSKRRQSLISSGLRAKENNLRTSLEKRKNCITLQLPNLSDEQVRQVLNSYLRDSDVSSEFVELVADVTGGNPYWVNSIAKFVRASGIQQFRTNIQQTDTKEGPMILKTSVGVQRLEHHIVCHLERFTIHQQTICKFASIIGDEFQLDVLLRILPPKFQNKERTIDLLQSLSEEGIVVIISEDPNVYSFQNELIRKTLYDFVLPSEAAGLHARIGAAIESLYSSNLRPYYPSLSYHYAMGINCRSNAFKYTVKAADQAISSGNFGTGLLYLQYAQSMLKYDSELLILLRVAETALFDMSPKYTILKRFLQSSDKLSTPPFTSEDILSYEKLVQDLTEAEMTMKLFGVDIIETKSRSGAVHPVIVLDTADDLHEKVSHSDSNGAALLSLPSYSARHPKNTRTTCLLS